MKIANIITNSPLTVNDNFNIISDPKDKIDGLPTLYIGFGLTDELFPNFDVTNIDLGNGNYWTMKKTEKRDKFNEDLHWFINHVYSSFINEINYVFVDNIQHNKKTLIKIYRKILSSKDHISFFNNMMVYMYHDKLIFGLDLRLFEYCGYDLEKLTAKIKKISKKVVYPNQIKQEQSIILQSLGNERKYVPVIFNLLSQ